MGIIRVTALWVIGVVGLLTKSPPTLQVGFKVWTSESCGFFSMQLSLSSASYRMGECIVETVNGIAVGLLFMSSLTSTPILTH